MKMLRLVPVVFLIGAQMLFAGPFGLEFGWANSEFPHDEMFFATWTKLGNGIDEYSVIPPIPHSKLGVFYDIRIDEDYGLYYISNEKKFNFVSPDGTEMKLLFDDLETQLTSAYGEGVRTDYISSGSVWTDSEDFMMTLYTQDKEIAVRWFPADESNSELSDTAEIELVMKASSLSSGTVTLTYHGMNEHFVDEKLAAVAERQRETDLLAL